MAVTRRFVQEGARVVAGSRTVSAELAELVEGGAVDAVSVDLAEPDDPARLVAAAGDRLDILVKFVNRPVYHARRGRRSGGNAGSDRCANMLGAGVTIDGGMVPTLCGTPRGAWSFKSGGHRGKAVGQATQLGGPVTNERGAVHQGQRGRF